MLLLNLKRDFVLIVSNQAFIMKLQTRPWCIGGFDMKFKIGFSAEAHNETQNEVTARHCSIAAPKP